MKSIVFVVRCRESIVLVQIFFLWPDNVLKFRIFWSVLVTVKDINPSYNDDFGLSYRVMISRPVQDYWKSDIDKTIISLQNTSYMTDCRFELHLFSQIEWVV